MNIATSDLRIDCDIPAGQGRQAHLWFLQCMDRVHRAIQGTDDLDRMMGDVLDAVVEIFDCDRAVLLYPCDPLAESFRVPMRRTRPEFPCTISLGLMHPAEHDLRRIFVTLRVRSVPARRHAVRRRRQACGRWRTP
jgi:hypothetical protein